LSQNGYGSCKHLLQEIWCRELLPARKCTISIRELLPESWCRELFMAHKCRISIRELLPESWCRELLPTHSIPQESHTAPPRHSQGITPQISERKPPQKLTYIARMRRRRPELTNTGQSTVEICPRLRPRCDFTWHTNVYQEQSQRGFRSGLGLEIFVHRICIYISIVLRGQQPPVLNAQT
jgi:hypothetical protein